MDPAFPVNNSHYLADVSIDVDYDFLDECSHDALLETNVHLRMVPNGCEALGQSLKLLARGGDDHRS
jgi:hypothetical protein